MQTVGRFAALTAFQIRMNHFAHDRPGTNDADLHHDVVKTGGVHAREESHLSAALDLEHANRVGFLQRLINKKISGGQSPEVDLFAIIVADNFQRIFEHSHHAET